MASPETVAGNTMAWCSACGTSELARIVYRDEGVFLERLCPRGGAEPAYLASDPKWYDRRVLRPRAVTRPRNPREPKLGCPRDCGPCARHLAELRLPIFSITNVCNLDCPICFTHNRSDLRYFKSLEDVDRIADRILERHPGQKIVDLTGGEPTMHPDLTEIVLRLKARGFGRVMVNTNGLRLAEDPGLAEGLAKAGAHVVLSLDTLRAGPSQVIHGKDIVDAKLRCLEALERNGIPTTLIFVAIAGINDGELAPIVAEWLPKPFLRSVTVQNMAYTGANGARFRPRSRIAMDEVERLLAEVDGVELSDFHTPSGAHPLCYSMAWYLVDQGRLVSLSPLLGNGVLERAGSGTYLPRLDAAMAEEFLASLAKRWADGVDLDGLKAVRKLALVLQDSGLSESDRESRIEESVRMLCVHPHMDEENFDLDRVSSCGDLVPDEAGGMVPACSYNLLYRERDPRFWKEAP